ncbi:MAG: hypothetical protein H5T33_01695 [Candidatus Methanosuratus sp.]|nr:hypothetical protein [Candidatus Methanosuratincola sp.]
MCQTRSRLICDGELVQTQYLPKDGKPVHVMGRQGIRNIWAQLLRMSSSRMNLPKQAPFQRNS